MKWNSVPRIQAIDLVVDRYAREMHVPKDNCVLHGSGEDFVFIAPAFVSYLDREARSLKSGAARSISRWYRYYAGLKKIRAQKLILCGAAICIQSAWRSLVHSLTSPPSPLSIRALFRIPAIFCRFLFLFFLGFFLGLYLCSSSMIYYVCSSFFWV